MTKGPNPNKHAETLTLAQTPTNLHSHTHTNKCVNTHPQDARRAGGGKGVSHESINPV